MNEATFVYVVYSPFSHAHMSAHVAGVYATEEGAAYAANHLMLNNQPQDHDRVIIQRCEIKDSTYALALLQSRRKTLEREKKREEVTEIIDIADLETQRESTNGK